jgi:uncharacterized membrane protein HdeD (DUF308 family)
MAVSDRRSTWLTIEGILLIVLGGFALMAPLFAGIALALTIGILLVVAGAVGLISAIAGKDHSHQGWSLLSAVIALVIGALLLISPLTGAVAITLLIGAYLLLDGISLIGLALDHRRRGDRAWGWLLVAGVVDIVLAAFIVFLSAAGSAVLIGFIVGLDLIVAGVALLMIHRRGVIIPPAS